MEASLMACVDESDDDLGFPDDVSVDDDKSPDEPHAPSTSVFDPPIKADREEGTNPDTPHGDYIAPHTSPSATPVTIRRQLRPASRPNAPLDMQQLIQLQLAQDRQRMENNARIGRRGVKCGNKNVVIV